MRKTGADIVYTLTGLPVPHGIVIQDDSGIILDILGPESPDYPPDEVAWYTGALCPGFINAHCHLDLSAFKGRIPEKTGLDRFIRLLTRDQQSLREEDVTEAAVQADSAMQASGIVAVLDITGNPAIWSIKKQSPLWYHQTLEVFGTDPQQAGFTMETAVRHYEFLRLHFSREQVSVSPHSPYSVSDELFAFLFRHAREKENLISLHHLENQDELEYFLQGTGAIPDRQQFLGIRNRSPYPKNMRPAEFLRSFPDYPPQIVFVHNTVATAADVECILSAPGAAWFCLCPSANLYIEDRLPDLRVFQAAEERICLGTDSLASNHQLSILEEIKCLLRRHPELETGRLLSWACRNGAKALGIDHWAGTLEIGKAPGLVLIDSITDTGQITAKSAVRLLTRHLPF